MKPPKCWLSEKTTKEKEEDGSKNRFGGGGGGDDDTFRNYMARKIELQRKQFGTNNNHDDDDDVRNIRSLEQQFMRGIIIMVNGYTIPDDVTLMRMVQSKGGGFEKYETSRVTHIIATELSHAKRLIYEKQKRPIPIVKPQWIVDCCSQNQKLSHAPYLLLTPTTGNDAVNITNFYTKQPPSTTITKSNSNTIQESTTIDNATSIPSSSSKESTDSDCHEKQQQKPSHKQQQATATCGNNANVKTVGNDPNFLDSYFRNSRLSFIGSFQQRKQHLPQNQHKQQKQQEKKDSLRFVFHIDMDYFFAAVVLRKYPQYKDHPVAIGHSNITNTDHQSSKNISSSTCELSTCNYHARKFGIKKGMFLRKALQLCPQLKVLPYDYQGYEEVSLKVENILQSYASQYNANLEQVSCDESYMEFYLPKNTRDNDDDDDDADDVYSQVQSIAQDIRTEVVDSTQCTVSIGIGSNKFQAKIATDQVKPNGCFVIVPNKLQSILSSLSVRDLPGVGYKIQQKLSQHNIHTVQDIQRHCIDNDGDIDLRQIIGPTLGMKLINFSQGKDDRPVQSPPRKTIGAECNYGVRFNGPYGVDYMIMGLAKEVHRRLEHVGVFGQRVTLRLKESKVGAGPPGKFNGCGSCHDYSKSGDTTTITNQTQPIFETAMALYKQINIKDIHRIRGMGIIVSKLTTQPLTTTHGGVITREPTNINFDCPKISTWLSDTCNSDNVEVTSKKTPTSPTINNDEMAKTNEKILTTTFSSPQISLVTKRKDTITSPKKAQQRKKRKENDVKKQQQTSVKRMLKLACVKASRDNNIYDQEISLTQLDCLPLELQLEIVNNDTSSMNSTNTKVRNRKYYIKRPKKMNQKSDDSNHSLHGNKRATNKYQEQVDDSKNEEKEEIVSYDFYSDMVLPLREWMENCSEPNANDIDKMCEFFRILVDEKRLDELMVLLRVVKKDSIWGIKYYKTIILQRTNEYLRIMEGRQLDIKYLDL